MQPPTSAPRGPRENSLDDRRVELKPSLPSGPRHGTLPRPLIETFRNEQGTQRRAPPSGPSSAYAGSARPDFNRHNEDHTFQPNTPFRDNAGGMDIDSPMVSTPHSRFSNDGPSTNIDRKYVDNDRPADGLPTAPRAMVAAINENRNEAPTGPRLHHAQDELPTSIRRHSRWGRPVVTGDEEPQQSPTAVGSRESEEVSCALLRTLQAFVTLYLLGIIRISNGLLPALISMGSKNFCRNLF